MTEKDRKIFSHKYWLLLNLHANNQRQPTCRMQQTLADDWGSTGKG